MIQAVLVLAARRDTARKVLAALTAGVLALVLASVAFMIILAGSGAQHVAEAVASSNCDADYPGDARWVGDVPPIDSLTEEQAKNAAAITAVAQDLDVPEYGVVIALAVAWQESRLVNVDYGDRDSLGLFQQRPSTGWGTPAQVTDTVLATRAFFGRAGHTNNTGLLDLNNWQAMPLGLAGQAVQRSADPTGSWYAQHELLARQIVARLIAAAPHGIGDGKGSVDNVGQPTGGEKAHRLRITHANIPGRSSNFQAALGTLFARNPDLVSLNEMTRRSRPEFTPPGYASWRAGPVKHGRSPQQALSTAVAWRTDRWQKVDAGRVTLLTDGPQRWDQRYANWVTVQSADVGQVSMISAHQMVNPRKWGPNRPLRRQLYRDGMHQLQELVRKLSDRGPVFLAGDMNSQYWDNDPWGPRATLAQVGMSSTMDVFGPMRTHVGGGSIDYIFYQDAAARPLRQWTSNIPSDHRVVGADFLTQRGGVAPIAPGGAGLMCGVGLAMDCPQSPWPDIEDGLTPDALRVLRCLHQQFPEVASYGGVGSREDNPASSHTTGRAVDAMIPNWDTPHGRTLGDAVADWVRENAEALGVSYVIWNARIWSVGRSEEGWRPYSHPSGKTDATSLHRDHVHVDVYGNAAGGTESSAWVDPVPSSSTITAEFGDCSALWSNCHTGLDFAAPTGTPVVAASAGTVVSTGNGGPYGNLIKIDHGNGVETWYAHLSSFEVSDGSTVRAGEMIGRMGSTGNTTGPHLHFEVREQGVAVDPAPFLEARGVLT